MIAIRKAANATITTSRMAAKP